MTLMNPLQSEWKLIQLELLLTQSDAIADALSLASLQSSAELIVLTDKGRDILKEIENRNGLVVLKGMYESVPILGRSPSEQLEEALREVDSTLESQVNAQLAMNLALFDTALIHTKKLKSLVKERGELVGKATATTASDNRFGTMQLAKRFGTIRYFDASALKLGFYPLSPNDELDWHIQAGIDGLHTARDLAIDPYNKFLAVFNLGRLEFLRGTSQAKAKEYFYHAESLAQYIGNESFEKLAFYYRKSMEPHFGKVIADPPIYQEKLLDMVTELVKPEKVGVKVFV